MKQTRLTKQQCGPKENRSFQRETNTRMFPSNKRCMKNCVVVVVVVVVVGGGGGVVVVFFCCCCVMLSFPGQGNRNINGQEMKKDMETETETDKK
jgi:hypothetical protein